MGEHLSELPGVGIGTDWQRSYPNGSSIRSIIGSVSTEKAGLPSDNLQYYLTNGYSRNDRVGTSYLEENMNPCSKELNQPAKFGLRIQEILNSQKRFILGRLGQV